MEKTHLQSLFETHRSHIILALKALTITVATLILFHQDLVIIFSDALQNETTSHILIIPILFAYLIYRKRKMLRAVVPLENQNQPTSTKRFPAIIGILLALTAILLYWHGSYTFTPLEYHIIALPIFTAGLTLILFNPQTLRQLAFPIVFLTFLTPPPSEILYGIGATLSVVSSEASSAIVNALGVPSTISSEFANPTIIITRPDNTPISFTVDIACSGIYSLIGFLIFAAFIAYTIRDKTWKKILIFLIGFPLIYLFNIIRITTILLIGYHLGEQTALQIFHLLGGWILILIGTLILLTITEKAFKTQIFTKKQQQNTCQKCNPKPSNLNESFCTQCGRLLKYPKINPRKGDIAKIATIAIAVILLVSIQAPVFALTKGPAPIIIQTPKGEQGNTQILPQIQGYTIQFLYRDTFFEQTAKQDASLVYIYMPQYQMKEPVMVSVEISKTRSSLHRWETCLITFPQTHGYQPKVTQLDLRDIQTLQNPPIIARYLAFQYIRYNQTQLVLYWYETATLTISNTTQQEHVKISLITFPNAPENITEAEKELLPFAIAIAGYWQPLKTWNQISLIISKNGLYLTAIPIGTLLLALGFAFLTKKREGQINKKAFNKLGIQDQQTLKAISQTQRKTVATLYNIQSTYQELTGKNIEKQELTQKLDLFKILGFVKEEVLNQQDQPTLVWKT